MKITINSVNMELQENDSVVVREHPCEDCGSHTEIEVRRQGKTIACFGEDVILIQGKKEIFGGVVVGKD